MSSPGKVAGATQHAAGETAATAKDEAAQVGSTAVSAASDVAGTTKEQASAVAGEAANQVRGLLDQTKQQVSEQAGGAQQKLGESLRSIADELRSMGDGSGSGSGPAAEVARNLADRGSAAADYIANKQPGELVQELRRLAARRPGGFLLGALVAGVAAGRLMKGVQADSASSSSQQSGRPTSLPPVPVDRLGTPPVVVDTLVEEPLPLDALGAQDTAAYPIDPATSPSSTRGGSPVPGMAPYTPGSGL